jgi:Fic family protein
MRLDDYRSTRAGRLEPRLGRSGRYYAFVPEPLPPEFAYDVVFVAALSAADAALGELAGVGRQLPNPTVLMTPYVRREAVLSSRIEGTHASIADVFADEALHSNSKDSDPDVEEVRNYVSAMEHGVTQLRRGRRLDLDLVLELHRILMTGVRGNDKDPGALRAVQNWIGNPGSTPSTAVFVPPHPDRVADAMLAWTAFARGTSRAHPPLIACGLLHQQFETIHPFRDGNGRIGRLLIPLYLIECGRLSLPLLYISAYLEANRVEYVRQLQRVRTDGAWESWVAFLIAGVLETARDGRDRATRIVAYYESARDAVDDQPHCSRLLRFLLSNPFISTTRAMRELGVTPPTARKALDTLVTRGVLEDAGKRGRTPLLVARQLLEIFGETAR